jgi:hypothetical protein
VFCAVLSGWAEFIINFYCLKNYHDYRQIKKVWFHPHLFKFSFTLSN